jgi:WD repeat-containing protein 53
MLRCDRCRGHSGSVLCVEHSSNLRRPNHVLVTGSNLLSGSEDKTCRLWDLRSLRTSICMLCPGEVLSVGFEPTELMPLENQSDCGVDYVVYAASENIVVAFDLRKTSSPIMTQPTTTVLQSADDVNQVLPSKVACPVPSARKSKSGKKNFKRKHGPNCSNSSTTDDNAKEDASLAIGGNRYLPNILIAADDTGSIRILPYDFNESSRSSAEKVCCHGSNESPSMVTAVALRNQNVTFDQSSKLSRQKSNYHQILASGGTDCYIKLWDIFDSKRDQPLQSIEIKNSTAGAQQVCNPPMVHSLSWSPSGRLLAGALGDGSVGIWQIATMDVSNGVDPLVMTARLEDAHANAVAFCLFPEWKFKNIEQLEHTNPILDDRLLCTAGNDCNIAFWDLGATICGDDALNPATMLCTNDEQSALDNLKKLRIDVVESTSFDLPKILFNLRHPCKPNWMASSRGQDLCFPASIFLADTSADIAVYTVPT